MPVLKQMQARPLIREAVVLDLGDLGRQAERLKAAAEARARQIVADAKAEAARLTETAHELGYEKGLAAGQVAGHEAGLAAGHAEAMAAGQEQIVQTTQAFAAVAEQWEQQRSDLERDARGAVLAFALRFARKVTKRVVEIDPQVAAAQVADVLPRVLESLDVRVLVHPEDRDAVAETLPDVLASLTHLQHVSLHEDIAVGRGGCRLQFGGGSIDATVDTQMQRLVELILPEARAESSNAAEVAQDLTPPEAAETS